MEGNSRYVTHEADINFLCSSMLSTLHDFSQRFKAEYTPWVYIQVHEINIFISYLLPRSEKVYTEVIVKKPSKYLPF